MNTNPSYIPTGPFNEAGLRKPFYPVTDPLKAYLVDHGRSVPLPLTYADLGHFDGMMPATTADGRAGLWNSVLYRPSELEDLHERLVDTYQLLIADGRHIEHLRVASIDLCPYGNSQPFRIKILNQINDNHDYYYIKRTDANRVYGLELEHLLSPNRINYICHAGTIVEEHIIGVPGDAFIADPGRYGAALNAVRLSKEFIKFNERCFVRLLGDMRAYNFVVDVIHDLDQVQYRIRSIDFDQQSHEGRVRMYLPQFFKENYPYVRSAQETISMETADQYRNEERALLGKRYKMSSDRVERLLQAMEADALSDASQLRELADGLASHHQDDGFKRCTSMGALLRRQLHTLMDKPAGRASTKM